MGLLRNAKGSRRGRKRRPSSRRQARASEASGWREGEEEEEVARPSLLRRSCSDGRCTSWPDPQTVWMELAVLRSGRCRQSCSSSSACAVVGSLARAAVAEVESGRPKMASRAVSSTTLSLPATDTPGNKQHTMAALASYVAGCRRGE